MDLVSLLAIIVFSFSWFLYSRTDESDSIIRLFLRAMMLIGAAIGTLGLILRLLS
jgi:hypothetical protein